MVSAHALPVTYGKFIIPRNAVVNEADRRATGSGMGRGEGQDSQQDRGRSERPIALACSNLLLMKMAQQRDTPCTCHERDAVVIVSPI